MKTDIIFVMEITEMDAGMEYYGGIGNAGEALVPANNPHGKPVRKQPYAERRGKMVNRYGTTSDMILQEVEDNGTTRLVAIDSEGVYLTTPNRVDSQLADIHRYGISRTESYRQMQDLGLDPHELFNANRHLIKEVVFDRQAGKAVNPLKASKRKM